MRTRHFLRRTAQPLNFNSVKWLSTTGRAIAPLSSSTDKIQPGSLIEEERYQYYDPKVFYAARIGETLAGRYQLVSKLGWGTTSTVWLAKETTSSWIWQSHRFVAVKIANASPVALANAKQEIAVSSHVLSHWSSHPGHEYVRPVIDSFEVEGIRGSKHLCLIFEALRQPLSSVGQQLGHNGRLPPKELKAVVPSMLQALDFLHNECHSIHTDLKADHFMIPFEDMTILNDYVREQEQNPPLPKGSAGRPVFESRREFGRLKRGTKFTKLTDFGLAVDGVEKGKLLFHDIQPLEYRAPEVILKLGWDASADVWNLGLVLWELVANASLLDGRRLGQPEFSHFTRFAQMIRLLGPPPPQLLQRADEEAYCRFYDDRGTIRKNDPFYSKHGLRCTKGDVDRLLGNFKYPELIPGESFNLTSLTPIMNSDEKARFIDFVRRMLAWDPERRPKAKDLLNDPWLKQ